MGIMDNEGHDPMGFGNVPRAATTLDEVLSLRSENASLRAQLHLASGLALARGGEVERLRAALTPSAETKAAYIGEFTMDLRQLDEFGVEQTARITIPWTSVKEIMRAIQKYADAQAQDRKP